MDEVTEYRIFHSGLFNVEMPRRLTYGIEAEFGKGIKWKSSYGDHDGEYVLVGQIKGFEKCFGIVLRSSMPCFGMLRLSYEILKVGEDWQDYYSTNAFNIKVFEDKEDEWVKVIVEDLKPSLASVLAAL